MQRTSSPNRKTYRSVLRKDYRVFIALTLALGMGISLGACRTAKQSESYTTKIRRDSLSLWQWDELVLVHERLDSTGTRPTERSTLRWHKTQHLEESKKQDSLHHIQTKTSKPSPKARRPLWLRLPWWLYLGVTLIALSLALRAYHILRPLLAKLSTLISKVWH